ncbi:glycosyltransferase family 4 protein [Postia placenta MAD-698-R-SB12]|uniref:Asparagine-linked glycosylation protein 2 n=1 Tax=Postia placenta MAD-698-R-SB12 TaxID=670580 RepID=A0A1X6MJ41_9APHY|nr:glycosyltransferase family 4 protein [Postia placenta MAD-698-R-SB12]OSX56256.1 glycosyltransferase family 4 protein [Postia placenta MAD-698-R-SB12]
MSLHSRWNTLCIFGVLPSFPPFDHSPVILPALEILEVTSGGSYATGIMRLFASISAPKLHRLVMIDRWSEDTPLFRDLQQQRDHYPCLRSLVVKGNKYVSAFPNCRTLWKTFQSGIFLSIKVVATTASLEESPFPTDPGEPFNPDNMLEDLASPHDGEWYFPKLKALTISHTSDVSGSALLRLVANRMQAKNTDPDKGVIQLEEIRVHSNTSLDQSDVDELRKSLSNFVQTREGLDWEECHSIDEYHAIELSLTHLAELSEHLRDQLDQPVNTNRPPARSDRDLLRERLVSRPLALPSVSHQMHPHRIPSCSSCRLGAPEARAPRAPPSSLAGWPLAICQRRHIDRTFPSIERAPIEVLNAVFDAVFDEGQKSLDRFARVQFLLAVMSIFLPWRAAARDIPALTLPIGLVQLSHTQLLDVYVVKIVRLISDGMHTINKVLVHKRVPSRIPDVQGSRSYIFETMHMLQCRPTSHSIPAGWSDQSIINEGVRSLTSNGLSGLQFQGVELFTDTLSSTSGVGNAQEFVARWLRMQSLLEEIEFLDDCDYSVAAASLIAEDPNPESGSRALPPAGPHIFVSSSCRRTSTGITTVPLSDLTPLDKLPIEIFSLIIEIGFEEIDILTRVRFVLHAASVSRTWRQLVLSTPLLWTTIHVSLPYRPPITFLSAMLERSRALTLDIDIDWVHPGLPHLRRPELQYPPELGVDYIHGVMSLLTGHIVRWRSLDICTDHDDPETNLSSLLIGTAPVLKKFRLYCTDIFPSTEDDDDAVDLRRFEAPHLISLHLESLPSDEDLARAIKRFPSVAEVTWEEKSEPWLRYEGLQLMQIFQPLRALRRLTLGGLDFADWNPPSDTAVQASLPTLEVIEFYDASYYILGDILETILAPCLRQVIIRDAEHDDDLSFTFLGFWNHSNRLPRLHSLVLEVSPHSHDCIPDAGALWAVFGFFHSIRIVTSTIGSYSPDVLLDTLSTPKKDGWQFPMLKALTVHYTSEIMVESLHRLVRNRNQAEISVSGEGVMRLETLAVHSPMPISQSDLVDFTQNVSKFTWAPTKPDWDINKDHFPDQYCAMELNNGLVPAADRIPFDMLQLIFEEAVESSDPRTRMRFSLAVASVSRTWRATAHNVAVMWTTIYISYLTPPPIEVIRQMLQRSQARPLEVYVDWVLNQAPSHDEPGVYWKPRVALAHSAGPHNMSYISKAIHLLTDHVRRWRTADVMWTGPRKFLAMASGKLRIAFIHPDLGIGGAERLVVDAALGLQQLGHEVDIYTSHHDPEHCFDETRDAHFPSISSTPKVVYPGINLAAYETKEVDGQDPDVLQVTSTQDRDRPTLLSLNRFEGKKNAALAVNAFARLRKNLATGSPGNMRLVIAGGYDPRLEDNMMTLVGLIDGAKAHTLTFNILTPSTSHVTIPPFDLTPTDPDVLFLLNFTTAQRSALLSASSTLALLYTPTNEHFGIGPVEAMVCGLPVLACNSGGPTESVVDAPPDERTGWLRPPDAEKWADALREIMALSDGEREALGERARRRAQEHFGMEAMAQGLEGALQEGVAMGPVMASSALMVFWAILAVLAAFLVRLIS